MKKVFSLILFVCLLSCDDGDLAIETVDFDSITTIQTCNTVSATTSNLLFKINGSEALILELPAGLIKNEISTELIEEKISTTTKLTYRIFSDDVDQKYFCDAIPPITPSVTQEIEAKAGTIFITTTTEDSKTFSHFIELSEITLQEEENGPRITDLQISEFGTVTTTN
jgi:hypothetical protein